MVPECFDWLTPSVAAAALAVLWIAEALWPLAHIRSPRLKIRLANLGLALINAGAGILFAVFTFLTIQWAGLHQLGLLRAIAWPGTPTPNLQTVPACSGSLLAALLALILLDGWHYAFHVAAHKIPWLWRLHAVHHHDEHLDATTAVRFHTAEIVVQQLISLPLYALLGVSVFHVLLFNLVLLPMAMFHHANLDLPRTIDRLLSCVTITPALHRVHHSRWTPQTDSNFASIFCFWDRLFGTFVRHPQPDRIRTGLDGFEPRDVRTLAGLLSTPFTNRRSGPGESEANE